MKSSTVKNSMMSHSIFNFPIVCLITVISVSLNSPLVNASTPPQLSNGIIEVKVDPNGILRQGNPQLSLTKASQIVVCLVELDQQKTQCFPKNKNTQRNCQNDFNCIINQVSFPDKYMGVILFSEQSKNSQNNIIGSGICSLDAPCILGTTQVNFQVSNTPNFNAVNLVNNRLYQYYNQQQSNPKTVAFAEYLINLSQSNSVTNQNQDLYQLLLQTIIEDIENNPRFWSNPSANYSPGVSSQLCENMPINSSNYRHCWYNITLYHHLQRHLRPALENYLYQALKTSNHSPSSSYTNLQNELTNLQNNYQKLIQTVILPSLTKNITIDENMKISLNQSIPFTLTGLYQETVFLTLQKLVQEGQISTSEMAKLITSPSPTRDLNFNQSSVNLTTPEPFPLWDSQDIDPLW